MGGWGRDLRYGVRMLARRPGASTIAVVALALGIGLTTVMFSIVEGVILRGLPFDGGDRIMRLDRLNLARPGQRQSVPVDDLLDWRARLHAFDGLAGYTTSAAVVSGDSRYTERYEVAHVTSNLFGVLRVRPVVGRDFTDADVVPGAPAVAIIGFGLWTARYGQDPAVVGRTLKVDGALTTVVGVMPAKFGFPQDAEMWLPQALTPPVTRGEGPPLSVVGRLADGVSEGRASAELAAVARQLASEHPENKDIGATLGPFVQRSVPAQIASTFATMLGAVFGVLLIACVNVTNLQLARAMERAREIAIRTAIGSGRWRIVRQLLAEGLLLSAAGALLGLLIAQAGTSAFMRAIAGTHPPFWIDVHLDGAVLLFVAGITVAATLVSSLLPGWRIARVDVNAVLKDDARGSTGVRMGRFSRGLVIVEVTASCILLIVSGLMIRSIVATSRFDYPFSTDDVFMAGISLPGDRSPADRVREFERIDARLALVPGVRAAALASGLPGRGGESRIRLEGAAVAEAARQPHAVRVTATPGYFRIIGASPLAGRLFTGDDRQGTALVAVVDQRFVRTCLSGGPAVGRRFRFGAFGAKDADADPWITIVGVIADRALPDDSGQPADVYVPLAQSPGTFATSVLLRTSANPVALTSSVRTAIGEIDDRVPVSDPNSVAGRLWDQGWPFRVFGGLFLTFGLAALVLAAAGLYGVMAFSVRRRTQEIGVRLALGASRGCVLRMVLWQGLWRVAVGVVAGIVPGWFVGTLMSALLSHVQATDPIVHLTTIATLVVTGVLACLAPALRAASVDPLVALRHE
jgi:putative ABC transport system permease protein